MPLVLKRVPALLEPSREITASVLIIGDPWVGGAGSGKSNIPTNPCIASTYEGILNDGLPSTAT